MSVKRTRSLNYLFMFREFEKRLKGTPGGSFLYNLYEYEKVIKFYSVTFSGIYEHEKEQRLRSITCSHVFTSMRKNKD